MGRWWSRAKAAGAYICGFVCRCRDCAAGLGCNASQPRKTVAWSASRWELGGGRRGREQRGRACNRRSKCEEKAEGSFVWIEVSKIWANHAFKDSISAPVVALHSDHDLHPATPAPICSIQTLKSLDKALSWLLLGFFQGIMRHQPHLATANPHPTSPFQRRGGQCCTW